MTSVPPAADRLADRAGLWRIERFAIVWTVVGAVVLAVLDRFAAAAVLTGVSAASIVGFRGLQGVVSALGPDEDDDETTEQSGPRPDRQRRFGARHGFLALARLAFLGGVLLFSLSLGPETLPGLVSGFSTLPAAFLTEGAWQAVRALRGKEDDGDS